MEAIIQTGYSPDALKIGNIDGDDFHPTSISIETTIVPLLPYDLMKLQGKIPVNVPNVPGYGAVGVVKKVGALRSNDLLNQRVIVMNPNGTFKQNITSNMPPLSIVIPESVSSESAAGVIGGMDTAYMLLKKIRHIGANNIVILGANSVVGLGLIQLINGTSQKNVFPKVRPQSEDYFLSFVKNNDLVVSANDASPSDDSLVIDIAGQRKDVLEYVNNGYTVLSIAIQDISNVHFVSEPIFPKDYSRILQLIASKQLVVPIDKTFSYNDVEQAFDYQSHTHSRGRNLISFK